MHLRLRTRQRSRPLACIARLSLQGGRSQLQTLRVKVTLQTVQDCP